MYSQQQITGTMLASNGLIAIDEHSSASCLIHDVTATGLNLTLLDSSYVPNTFVLFAGSDVRLCKIVRRSDEEVEAAFADLPAAVRTAEARHAGGRSRLVH